MCHATAAIPGFSPESQIEETQEMCTSGIYEAVPSFIDQRARYAPQNVKRRENRKHIKIRTLRRELKALKRL